MQSNCETMTDRSETTQFTRLPTTVTPIHYDITLKPNLKSFTFSGFEVIKVVVNEETDRIVLNAKAIDIRVASFTPNNGKTLSADRIVLSVETETVSLEFNERLTTGTGVLRIEFSGCLNDKLKGFYRTKYTTPDGREERYAAVTHFEPSYARQAFPNWDEPAFKATFDITLVIPINRVGLSNSTVISEIVLKDDPNLKEVKFATTPVMSTYLVAVIVGEFDYVEDMTSDGVTVRVYTPLDCRCQGLFALEVAVKALSYFNDYFTIAYPLPKIDLIAIADVWLKEGFVVFMAYLSVEHTSTVDILELLDAFANEDNYIWKSIDNFLVKLDIQLSHTELQPMFHEFERELLSRIHSRLGWEPIKDETELDTLLRSLVTNRLASFGDQTVISEAKKLFESHLKGTHVIPLEVRQSVYHTVLIDCEDKTFNALFKFVSESFASEERAQELETFLTNNPIPGTERTVQEFETIRLNDKWLKRDFESIRCYLSKRLNI